MLCTLTKFIRRQLKKITLLDILFSIGYGITLHGIANELYYKGGYGEILSFQGEWIGLFLIIISYILIRHLQ